MTKDKSIFIRNIYYMLSYAFKELGKGVYESVDKEEFENIHNLFAAILSKGIGKQIKQGLYREYTSYVEARSSLRGKIDMPGTVKLYSSQKRELSCEYDELSENNLLNQILKTTALLLIRHSDVRSEYKDDLKKKLLYFSAVDTIEPSLIKWTGIRFHRNNNSYRVLISVCQLIIEGMLLTTTAGEYKLMSFIDDQRMCRLYEKFILEYYIKEWPQLKASASEIPWALDDGVGTLLPRMQSDIVLRYKETTLVIDAKYYSKIMQKNYDVETVRSNNLYQIFTYVKNLAATQSNDVSGLLLYAKTDNGIQPDMTYQMHGNQISVKTLDLNSEFTVLSQQLDDIANSLITSNRECVN